MSSVQKTQAQPNLKKSKMNKLKSGSLKASKKHRDVPDKIFDDYLFAIEDCEYDIDSIEQESYDSYMQYLEDIEFCKTIPDKDDLSHIDSKYKGKIGIINYEINCLESDNSFELRTIEKQFAESISIFVRKYLIEYQIKCNCHHQNWRSQDCDSFHCDNDDYFDVESFINAVTFYDECESSSYKRRNFGNYYNESYYCSNYYSSDESSDDEEKRQPSLTEIYSADTKIYQCLCFDTILNYLIQYQNLMSDVIKQHIPKTPKVMDLSKLCEINIANMMSIPSLKSTLSANINSILQVKKLDTYQHITFYNRFDFDKKTKFANIEKVLKALEEYIADGNIRSLIMCIDAKNIKKELGRLRKTYSDKVDECNAKYKKLISSLQKQCKELYQQRSDEIKDLFEHQNPNFKDFLSLCDEHKRYSQYLLYV